MRSKILKYGLYFCFAVLCCSNLSAVEASNQPIATDSRIRTLVYTESEVFRVVVHYGYQTSLEFAEGEEVQTISVGTNYAWQLSPLGRRLFIRPLEEGVKTNMTIITNRRTYQFEIESKAHTSVSDEELVYVVRFFYPDEELDSIEPGDEELSAPTSTVKPYNFNYTLEGNDAIAPLKVFDDGINTFFEFLPDTLYSVPTIQAKDKDKFVQLEPREKGGYIVVNKVASEFKIRDGDREVTIYNESL
jgi:type IV secretion system protein VirB9